MELEMFKKGIQTIDEYFELIRGNYKVKESYQGVRIEQIEGVLNEIGKYSNDLRDVVRCLLDDEFPSLFSKAYKFKFFDGASIAHIGAYVGILMRDKTKLDREGRDYWIKPLREIGAIDALTFYEGEFVHGHVRAKSPNSCYRLNSGFVDLLKAYGKQNYKELFANWISTDGKRQRLEVQVAAESAAKSSIQGDSHQVLIQRSIDIYAHHFLPGYLLVYKDDADGDRINNDEKALMNQIGLVLELDDVFPDVILYNETTNSLWFIEAVTSDGEVDEHKINGLIRICKKSKMVYGGATTTYLNWMTFATRQQRNKNLAGTSQVWILEDPQKQFQVNYYRNSDAVEI